ncbi:hypothetical protein [Derxia lacustris]|uniref:hypothetical protein n=1 Tax=Derxia lacustris TaxID=764842 RepID=UPI00111C7161|nr:hypothetical protein [Derxia lacustris]
MSDRTQQTPNSSAKPEKKDQSAEPANTRWWESYLVRYFIGFVCACACIIALSFKFGLLEAAHSIIAPTASNLKPDWSALVILGSALSVGFCYIASSPITVLHAGRYRKGRVDQHSRNFWLAWTPIAAISVFLNIEWDFEASEWLSWCVAIFILCILFSPASPSDRAKLSQHTGINARENFITRNPRSWFAAQWLCWLIGLIGFIRYMANFEIIHITRQTFNWWILSLPVAWIGIAQYAVLFRVLFEQDQINIFYQQLFNSRRQAHARDIRDTYTHLREHSNSVFIVVVEIAIFSWVNALYDSMNYNWHSQSEFPTDLLQHLLGGLFIWMVPTVFLWSRANAMERAFAENPELFLSRRRHRKVY